MYVFLSPAALESKWVLFESGYAYSRGIRVVPVGIFGVDLAQVGPPLGLLQGFNISAGPGMNNLIKIINDVFEFSFPEAFAPQDYQETFLNNWLHLAPLFGKHTPLVDEVIFDAYNIHSFESGKVKKFLADREVPYVERYGGFYIAGMYLPHKTGAIRILVDPLLSRDNFALLEELIPLMAETPFDGYFNFDFRLPPSVRAADEIHRLSARIFGSKLKLTEDCSVALDALHLKISQSYKYRNGEDSFISNAYKEPSGVRIQASYKSPSLREAPISQALDILFRVGVLFFDSP